MDEGPWTLYELKEFLVEWGARSWSPASISNTISPNNLISMSMLDSSILEEGVPLYSGPDLDISLRHDMSGATRQEWLLTTIRGGLRDLNARSAVDRLLDEDLRAAGDFSLIGQPQSYDHKAQAIAGHRIKKNLSFLQQPSHSMEAGGKSEFAAMLRGLVGGNGGCLSNTDLFFDYSTSFPLFQIILRDATKLSTIPPIGLEQQNYYQKETSPEVGSDTSSPASSIHHDRRFQKRVYDRSSERSDRTLSPVYLPTLGAHDCPNPQGTPKPRSPDARGYTTDDGPWLYRIEVNGQARSGPFTEIKDEKSYLKMVDHIKEMSRKDTSIEYKVVLFHSMDKVAYDKWRVVQAEDAKAEKQFQKAYRRGDIANVSVEIGDDDVDEDDIGEPYLEWLATDLARQKMEQQNSPGTK